MKLLSSLRTDAKKRKRVLIGVSTAVVTIAIGVGTYTFLSKPSFCSEFPKGMGLTVGSYRYTMDLTTKEITDTVDASVESLNKAEGDATAKPDKSTASSNFDSTWTDSDGVQTGRKNSEPFCKLVFQGYTKSVEPFSSMGALTMQVESDGKEVLLFKYTAKDDVLYIDCSETRQSLLSSGNGALVEIGTSLPEIRSLRLEKSDMAEFLGIEDEDKEFSYKELSSAVKLFWVSALNEVAKTDKGVFNSVQYTNNGKLYYSLNSTKNSDAISNLYSSLFSRDFYEGYITSLSDSGRITTTQECRLLSTSLLLNGKISTPVLDALPTEDLGEYSASTENWVRLNNGEYEIGLDLQWRQPSKDYLCDLSIQCRKVSQPKNPEEIVVPNMSTSYADYKDKSTVDLEKILRLLLQCTTGIGEDYSSETEEQIPSSK